MKMFIIFVLTGVLVLFFTGCGSSLDKGWNGLYKSKSEYYILLYTKDDKEISLRVIRKNKDLITYPIQYDSISIKNENTIEYSKNAWGDILTLTIIKSGNKIIVNSSSTDQISVFNEISGSYTKYKNVSSADAATEFNK